MKKITVKIVLLILVPFLLSGCVLKVKNKVEPDGGIYRTSDNGMTWEKKSDLLKTGAQTGSLAGMNIVFLKQDPTDHLTFFASTQEQGLFVSWDGATSWRSLLADKGLIVGMAVDSQSPCVIYAATAKDVYKTYDCGRKWQSIFYEKRTNATLTNLVIDTTEPSNIFLGISVADKGEIIWSQDSGLSWQVLKGNFKSPVQGIYINPKNTRILYATLKKGFYRSPDKGITWEDLSKRLEELKLQNGDQITDLTFLPNLEDGVLTVSKYGLLRSENSGVDWQAYILLQQPNTINIYSLALNQNDPNEIYYGTDRGIYRTVDGGANWITLKSPTSRYIKTLIMDQESPNQLYFGAWSPPKN
ncbi:MAG: hypothetical protein WC860_03830 [Candidatus Margulisiibacteriota bacterium]|jgi:photosystem II stability/assembly factor-like uncharacterized protein